MSDRLIHIADVLPAVVAAAEGVEQPDCCGDCGRQHETPCIAAHKCRVCQRRTAIARHDHMLAELRTMRAGGRRTKGGSDAG